MILELHATPEEVMRAVQALWEFGTAKEVPEKMLFGLAVALEESGSNIVNHSLERDPKRKFQVAFQHTNGAMIIELRDSGAPFDPTLVRVLTGPEEDEPVPGGWGLPLIRRYTDDIVYTREADENVLRLTKRLDDKGQG